MIMLKIADPKLAVWLCSNPMRAKGDIISVVVITAALALVLPWVVHPEAWER